MNDIMDMKISGSSAMPGGEYRTVSISGSGKVQGSLRCESLRCSGSVSCAQVGDIEGDDVDLEYTQADVVRGRRVRIGEGCSIGRVEYSESLDAWDGTVGESVCTGEGAQ